VRQLRVAQLGLVNRNRAHIQNHVSDC